jgi:hypothetical protein
LEFNTASFAEKGEQSMAITTSKVVTADRSTLPPSTGDAKGSIQQQLDNLDSLHTHEASQAEDQQAWSDSHVGGVGGLHSAEALSKHLEKGSTYGPRFTGAKYSR